MMEEIKFVKVSKHTWERLSMLKIKMGKRSINDVVEELLDFYKEGKK